MSRSSLSFPKKTNKQKKKRRKGKTKKQGQGTQEAPPTSMETPQISYFELDFLMTSTTCVPLPSLLLPSAKPLHAHSYLDYQLKFLPYNTGFSSFPLSTISPLH